MFFQVIYNGYDDMQAQNKLLSSSGRNRDYEKEAVQFFVNKLTKFGPELQVLASSIGSCT